MVQQLIPLIFNIISFCVNTFWNFLGAVGAKRIWLYVIYMLLSYRFILRPVFGWAEDGRSDTARKK